MPTPPPTTFYKKRLTLASDIPFFGRAWALIFSSTQSNPGAPDIIISSDAFEPEALRVTFDINQYAFSAFWHAEITIFNANGGITAGPSKGVNLTKAVISEGDTITLMAGYQADYPDIPPPIIWQGQIFYTLQDRDNVVDQRLIIHSLVSRALTTQNFINATAPAFLSQFEQARYIADNSVNKIQMNPQQIQSALSAAPIKRGAANLPRAKTYFGPPHQYLQKLAEQANCLSWFDAHHWQADSLQKPTGELVGTYAPVNLLGGPPQKIGKVSLSLIGQPQQTQQGVTFRILLDPKVQVLAPLPLVSLQKQYIRQAPIPYPLPPDTFIAIPLSEDDTYVVVGVRFIGDTRGNAWYTDVIGATQIQTVVSLLGQFLDADHSAN
jgi:hypothetical protein